MLEVPERSRPYLRRAYSVADADPATGEVEFLVKTIGAGTSALERLTPGSSVRLLGPFGNAFSLDGVSAPDRVAIVAGGIGAAPFPLVYRSLARSGIAGDLFLGGRSAADLSIASRFAGIVTGKVHWSTDDGSAGERGFITDVFARHAASTRYSRVLACGPMPMFAALAPMVARLGIKAQFSTEAAMGCGFGACLACVIPGADQPFLVSCQEGPILDPARIRW
jgi:dihydroorotate dehydrogenase electron transfer subunit